MKISYILTSLSILLCAACGRKEQKTLFRLLDNEDHGITFSNDIHESDSFNILTLEYIYNGGGVGVADFNNDGLSDVFFSGNMVPNRLYLNQGKMKFQDVSGPAGILPSDKWHSGVAVADVNADGLMDIYVCATIKKDSASRKNLLYINQGLDERGIPKFLDKAKEYGIEYAGHTTHAAFFDYDNDGDLDLYLLTNLIEKGIPTSYRAKIDDGSALNSDVLYRNNNNGTFTNVSAQAGIIHEGYGLGLAIADINLDGWQDIYVSNDYITNDILYINNKDGTFTNRTDEMIRHQSQFSMGNDIADINNDALPDIITLDMLPESNLRRKTVINAGNYTNYINNEKYGYAFQYIRNMVQLNNGNNTFSEVGQLMGVHQTEWSWSPLLVDIDNDGNRDLLITNGFPKDITDKDFGNYRNDVGNVASFGHLIDSIPVVKVPNCAFRNDGGLRFKDATEAWGLTKPSFSNGAAIADFDNDGDLDYIVNNINDPVFLYENTLYSDRKGEKNKNHYLRIKLKGNAPNPSGFGTKIWIRYGDNEIQFHDHSTSRGYLSTVEDFVHFGLGSVARVDSILVQWPDGKLQRLEAVASDQTLIVDYAQAQEQHAGAPRQSFHGKTNPLVTAVTKKKGVLFKHVDRDIIDFNVQRTIPHKFSQAGPAVAVGDVNGDEREDFFIAGSGGEEGVIYHQQKDGTFLRDLKFHPGNKLEEDQGSLFFDADNDGDLDLYVASGSFENPAGSPLFQDRLYRNDGKGDFAIDKTALPSLNFIESCVRAADFDMDGDLDLFVGGRVVPAQYPYPASSCILRNEGGKFLNVTPEVCPVFERAGMITDALWSDYNNDGMIDLIVTGEFMPITVFVNDGVKFSPLKSSGLEDYSGWWNSITGADFDQDGDIDFVAGNLGLNNYYKASQEHPLKVFAKDFDGNNSVDAILACYFQSEDGKMRLYPVHSWDELNSQSPKFRRKFSFYKQYAKTTMDDLLNNEEKEDMLILETNYTATSYIENLGSGKFKVKALPVEAQTAPVNGLIADDFNNDGYVDIMMIGNDYGNEVFAGRYDAFTGLILTGNGRGDFKPVPIEESGFFVNGDGKSLVKISAGKQVLYLASQNRDSVKVFARPSSEQGFTFKPESSDAWAEALWPDGRKQKIEFYYGSGYLSQSTRAASIPAGVSEIRVYNSKGESRKIAVSPTYSQTDH
ncbi:MAG: VCBS repeat-containing protein [Chryseosolibacter sp.]